MGYYDVDVELRSANKRKDGKRPVVKVSYNLFADSHEQAIGKAHNALKDRLKFTVKRECGY